MKKPSIILVFLVTFASSAFAQDNMFSTSGFVALKNAYVLDNGYAPNDEPVTQVDIFLKHTSGAYIDLWGSVGLTRSDQNEIDILIGYAGEIRGIDFKIDLPYYEIKGGIDMTAPLVEFYPAKGWSTGAQYFFGTAGDQGKKFWAGYTKGAWSAQVSYTDFFGRVTAVKGAWVYPFSKDVSASLTAIVPIADPDNTGNDTRIIAAVQWTF